MYVIGSTFRQGEEESMMDEKNYEVLEFLSTIPDPRIERCKRHNRLPVRLLPLLSLCENALHLLSLYTHSDLTFLTVV